MVTRDVSLVLFQGRTEIVGVTKQGTVRGLVNCPINAAVKAHDLLGVLLL